MYDLMQSFSEAGCQLATHTGPNISRPLQSRSCVLDVDPRIEFSRTKSRGLFLGPHTCAHLFAVLSDAVCTIRAAAPSVSARPAPAFRVGGLSVVNVASVQEVVGDRTPV